MKINVYSGVINLVYLLFNSNLSYEMVSDGITQSKERNDSGTLNSCDSTLCAEEESQRRSINHERLENDIDRPLYTHDLISWAFQVSRGMAYLAGRRVCF